MYCNRCGGEFGPRESSCFNCGEPRPVREKTFEKDTFMSGSGLKDNYIPMLWELLILYLMIDLIAYLIVPESSYQLALSNIFQGLGSLTISPGLSVNSLGGFLQTMFSRLPRIWKVSTLISGMAALLYLVLFLVAAWRIFKKAGMPGWKCLIPIYNLYCVFKIVMGNGWFFLLIPAYYVVYLIFLSGMTTTTNGIGAFTAVSILMAIAAFIFIIWFAHKAAVRYHHGWGYTIGFLLFTNLFIMFLGFGGGTVDLEEIPPSDGSKEERLTSLPEEQDPELSGIKRCPACGQPVDPDWIFCRHCGARLLE